MILSIETSSDICSVCISEENKLIDIIESEANRSHAARLSVFIDELLKRNKLGYNNLDAIAVSMGPGSYTGLRIGVSMAKGLCYGLQIPLISVSTLYSLASAFRKKQNSIESDCFFIPMIDARRMEVYTCVYDENLNIVEDISAEIIDENSFGQLPGNTNVYLFGQGAEKCQAVINKANFTFVNGIFPSSVNLIDEAYRKFTANMTEDIAYFEPFYLKDFIAKKPKNKFF